MHLLEGFVDNIIGWVINYIMVLVIYNGILGYEISLTDNAIGGTIMFFIAWVRKYLIRRFFSNKIKGMYESNDVQKQTGAH